MIEAALTGEVPHAIKNVTGVIGFLGDKNGSPVPLRLSEVNRILGKVDELAESNEEINIPFIVGETVKVIDGPFNSFSGDIEEINEEKKKYYRELLQVVRQEYEDIVKNEVQRAIRGFAPVVGAKWREIESAMTLYSQRKDKPIQSITRSVETVTSIPTYQIFEMVEGGLDAFTTENSETIRALRFLGYSRYKFQEGAVKENTLIDEWNAHLSEKLLD